MLFAAALSLFLSSGSSLAVATPISNTTLRGCGTTPSKEVIAQAEARFARSKKVAINFSDPGITIPPIPVYWHVVHNDTTLSGGYIPDSQIESSISVLNAGFASCGISFNLTGTDRTLNVDWHNQAGLFNIYDTEMKGQLRKGEANALNVYSVGFVSGPAAGFLGYAAFPSDYADAPQIDGVVINYASVPGGSGIPNNEGKTLTHEAGHWVGLYHTFQGGCDGLGDYVDDTSPEAIPAAGCPVGRDTCPGGGSDPIHNYMDYAEDPCMENFTPGQCTRLLSQIATYRNIVPTHG